VALVLVLFVILALYVNPVLGFVDAWRDSKSERAQLHQLQHEHARLRERARHLDDPGAAERAARRLGMIAPGETSYALRDLPK
jgi:cell division protein FtsB